MIGGPSATAAILRRAMEIVFGLGAAITYGAADYIGGLVTRRTAVFCVTFLSQVLGTGLLAVAVLVIDSGSYDLAEVGGGAPAGVAFSGRVTALYHGHACRNMGEVVPTTRVNDDG